MRGEDNGEMQGTARKTQKEERATQHGRSAGALKGRFQEAGAATELSHCLRQPFKTNSHKHKPHANLTMSGSRRCAKQYCSVSMM